MRGGEGVLIEAFAAGGLLAVKARSIPGRLTGLNAARIRFKGNSGEGEGGRYQEE